MLLVALGLGYGFGLFEDVPRWLISLDIQASVFALLIAVFGALLILWLADKFTFLRELFRELSEALPERDFKWNLSAGLVSGFVEEFAFRGVLLMLLGPHWSSV